jgi:hypothetical protein
MSLGIVRFRLKDSIWVGMPSWPKMDPRCQYQLQMMIDHDVLNIYLYILCSDIIIIYKCIIIMCVLTHDEV